MHRAVSRALSGAAVAVLFACSPSASPSAHPQRASAGAAARVDALQAAVSLWASAETLAEAKSAAETAHNLVTGPDVRGYGDLDGDGHVAGDSEMGLLPGEDGQPGLVTTATSPCVEHDVLGGSWADPGARWAAVRTGIAQWTPRNNTFAGFVSHPQRVVGWASLTLKATSLDVAHEYAGHAKIHVAATRAAIDEC